MKYATHNLDLELQIEYRIRDGEVIVDNYDVIEDYVSEIRDIIDKYIGDNRELLLEKFKTDTDTRY